MYRGPVNRLSGAELAQLIASARRLAQPGTTPLRGKHIALLGREDTPLDPGFERAAEALGARVARLHAEQLDWGRVELLGRLYDAIECQSLDADRLQRLTQDCAVPIFDGIGRAEHPSALIADLMSVQDLSGGLPWSALRLHCEAAPGTPAARAWQALAQALGLGADAAGAAEAIPAGLVCRAGPDGGLPMQWSLNSDAATQAEFARRRELNRARLLQALLCRALG